MFGVSARREGLSIRRLARYVDTRLLRLDNCCFIDDVPTMRSSISSDCILIDYSQEFYEI